MSNILDGVNPANIAGVTAARELLVLPTDVATGMTAKPPALDTFQGVTTLVSSQLFVDTFDASFDTTNNWNTATVGGTGVAFAFSTASITGGTGTTANSFSFVTSRFTFQPGNPGYLEAQHNIGIPDGAAPIANSYRAWGFMTPQGAPTAANPIVNGLVFEIDITGKMFVAVYQTGTRAVIQNLSSSGGNSKQPLDGSAHKYYMWTRGDIGFFAIDSRTNVVATFSTGALGPDITALPVGLLCVAGAVAPLSNASLVDNMTCVGDTANSALTISDPQFPFRQATVKAASTAVAATDLPLVVGLHPSTTARIAGNAGALVDGAIAAAPPANALQIGVKAATANPANATAGNQVAIMGDKAGRIVVTTGNARELVGIQNTAVAVATADQVIVTAAASTFNDMSCLIMSNTVATTNVVTLKDAVGGTIRAVFSLPAAIGVTVVPFPVPMPQAAVNTAWCVTQSAATGVNYTAIFVKNL